VGNPAPDFQDSSRAGDNLYSNSVVALDPLTGALKWHFQFTPGDAHDWDAAQQPLLADIRWRGHPRAAMLWANRNGFFYALDRQSGEFFFAKPFAEQTWAKGFSPEGRPIAAPGARPTAKGSLVSPAAAGATNWWPPSYDPARKLVYVPTVDAASIYFARNGRVKKSEEPMMGSWDVFSGGESAAASVKAVEAETGKVRWVSLLERSPDIVHGVGGVLSTAGGLVFAGYRDEFFAIDSDTGRILWRMRLGGRINAAPVAYAVGKTEFIALMAGDALHVFSLPPR
jgi:alcohol dehydrogenase (cytochrome c)